MNTKYLNIYSVQFSPKLGLLSSLIFSKGSEPRCVFLVRSFLLVTITHGNISVSPSHCTNTKKRSGVKKTIKIIQ